MMVGFWGSMDPSNVADRPEKLALYRSVSESPLEETESVRCIPPWIRAVRSGAVQYSRQSIADRMWRGGMSAIFKMVDSTISIRLESLSCVRE